MRSSGAPTWMVTFADLMALMMTFFVLLYSFSVIDEQKYKSIVNSLTQGFGGPQLINFGSPTQGRIPTTTNTVHVHSKPLPVSKEKKISEKKKTDKPDTTAILLKKFQQVLAEEIRQGKVYVKTTDGNVVVTFPERVTFDSGSDQLNISFKSLAGKVTNVLSEISGYIVIAGHTDDRPINTERFRSNWDLSTARAVSMAHAILAGGKIDSGRIIVVGHSSSHPMMPNTSEENRARNRRVEISIFDDHEKLPHFFKH